MNILQKLLQKRGLESFDQLSDQPLPDGSPSEKQIYETYQKILSKEKLTIEDVAEFCQSNLNIITGKWSDLTVDSAKKAELIPFFTIYSLLLQTMQSPQKAREQLEQNLNQLLLK